MRYRLNNNRNAVQLNAIAEQFNKLDVLSHFLCGIFILYKNYDFVCLKACHWIGRVKICRSRIKAILHKFFKRFFTIRIF